MRSHARSVLAGFGLVVLLAFAQSAVAQSAAEPVAPPGTAMENLIVIGEREPGDLLVTDQVLERVQATSLDDIFSYESSLAVGGGSATAHKLYVRGLEDVMLNVTIDGAQSPGELYHHQSRVQIEPEFVRSIELDAGAGAATHGAGALTGALRVTLKDAFDLLEDGRNIGGFVRAGLTRNGGDGDRYSAAVYGRLGDRTGLIVGYTRKDRDDYTDGRGNTVEATPYDRARGFVKLNSGFGDHRVDLSFENVADDATTFERPNLTNFSGNYLLSDHELNRSTVSFSHGFDPVSDAVDTAFVLYTNTTDFRVQRHNSPIVYGEGEFESIGFDLRNTSLHGPHSLTYGVDHRADDLASAQNATPPFAWGNTRQSASVTGLYLQDDWSLTDSLELGFGVRYDDYTFEGDGGVSAGVEISDSGFSPNVALTFRLTDAWSIRAAYAQAFRGVTIREAFFSGLYLHDGTLRSETADNAEIGFAYETSRFFVRGTWYEQNIEDFIDSEFVGGAVWGYWRNVGDAKIEGYEAEVGGYLGRTSWSLGVWNADTSLNDEPLTDGDMGLGTNIGRTWIARVAVAANDRLAYGADLRHVESERNAIAPGAPDKAAYTVARAYAHWSATDRLGLSIAVNNLFDEFYYDHATYTYIGAPTNAYVGYPAIGREFEASARFRF